MSDTPHHPQLRPEGPVILTAAADVWHELTAARAGVEAYRGEAIKEVEARLEAARRDGFSQGLSEAAHLVSQTVQSAQDMLADVERRLPEFATHVIVEVLGQIGPTNVIAALAEQAAQGLVGETAILCKVHPDLVGPIEEVLRGSADPDRLQVRPDSAMDVLGCRLETGRGTIDPSLDRQIARLREAFAVAVADGARPR
jgi:flagellar biosynthesis/type III secretory pathway protein FliH